MYNKKTHVHFVGIGGIGMSGIAHILKRQGYHVSGCDIDLEQKSVRALQELGCSIYHNNNTPQCKDSTIDIVVYSSAIQAQYPEIVAAQARGIPTIPRALMLAELMRTKFSIAIAGAHGKTTTTSLVSHIFIEAEQDPTVIIGGHLKNISTNARFGKGEFLIAEADESDRSLLRLHPTLAIVTNIDLEHLDVYKDIQDIQQTFAQFLQNIPFYGKAFVCADDIRIQEILPLPHIKTIKFGIENEADYYARDIVLASDHVTFTVHTKKQQNPLGTIKLAMLGRHNILNTLAAIAVADNIGIPFTTIQQALNSFKGIERRFSFKGIYKKNIEIFDDYGHHPTEIYHTLSIARLRAKKRLIVVFQPHRYSRTQKLWREFITTFMHAPIDHLIISDIYAASEAPIPGITAGVLTQALQQQNPKFSAEYVPANFETIAHRLDTIAQPDDLILFLGAGNLHKLADILGKN